MPEAKKVKKFAMPKTIAACVDLYYKLRELRLSKQCEAKETQEEEAAVREHLINVIPKSDATGVTGKLANVTVIQGEAPEVVDVKKFLQYVIKTGSFDLLNVSSMLKAEAAKERWEDGVKIPGVGRKTFAKLSVKKVSQPTAASTRGRK